MSFSQVASLRVLLVVLAITAASAKLSAEKETAPAAPGSCQESGACGHR